MIKLNCYLMLDFFYQARTEKKIRNKEKEETTRLKGGGLDLN